MVYSFVQAERRRVFRQAQARNSCTVLEEVVQCIWIHAMEIVLSTMEKLIVPLTDGYWITIVSKTGSRRSPPVHLRL